MSAKPNFLTMNHEARRRKFDTLNKTKQLNYIYERDNGICQICFKPCLREDASRDHIKKFAECTPQEARSESNMRLAHKLCNNELDREKPGMKKQKEILPLTYRIEDAFPILKGLLTDG